VKHVRWWGGMCFDLRKRYNKQKEINTSNKVVDFISKTSATNVENKLNELINKSGLANIDVAKNETITRFVTCLPSM